MLRRRAAISETRKTAGLYPTSRRGRGALTPPLAYVGNAYGGNLSASGLVRAWSCTSGHRFGSVWRDATR
jgi:hypothetical protein